MSLLRKVCYPESCQFTPRAIVYGCEHEKDAIEAYKSSMSGHLNFKLAPCGFFVDQQAPYLGASPDALVECSCCGCGVVEVKCPLCAKKARSLDEVVEEQKKVCLQRLETGLLQLSREHSYYLLF